MTANKIKISSFKKCSEKIFQRIQCLKKVLYPHINDGKFLIYFSWNAERCNISNNFVLLLSVQSCHDVLF